MIRKLFVLSLLVLAIPVMCFAAADTARSARDLGSIVGIGDGSSGYLLEINSNTGSALTTNAATAVTSRFGPNVGSSSGVIYTGACRLLGVYISGVTAGDSVEIYDAASRTGTAVFDPRLAANTSSQYLDAKGAPFSTGIFAHANVAQTLATFVYDY